jgi:hypothetical protein
MCGCAAVAAYLVIVFLGLAVIRHIPWVTPGLPRLLFQ